MFTYILKRLGMTVVVLLLSMVFLSLLVQVVPGDAAVVMLGNRATPEQIQKARALMDLDQPFYVQVGRFIWRAVRGDFGNDWYTGRPIIDYFKDAFWHTFALAWASLGLAVLLGVPLGVYSASHPNSLPDRLLAVLSISFITLPSYVAGLFLLLLFAVRLKILPATGAGDPTDLWDYIRHLILPATAMAITWVGYLARLVRSSLLEVLNSNYIRVARAHGLRGRLIFYKYALKNALIPTVAVLGMGIGGMMGGAVIIEAIFARPGMGTVMLNAVGARNYPIVRAGSFIISLLFILTNLVADISYSWLDPRIQLGQGRRK